MRSLLALSTAFASNGIRWMSSDAGSNALRFCVVGSGPAGFYTVDKILKRFGDSATVDIVEALPTPFGLVRSGVAPDHPDTKNVINQFTTIAQNPRVSFFGNVRVGESVSLKELQSFYNGVVLAYGAEHDRQLNVPGEDLSNVFSAREFVWWYNGHPKYTNLPVYLDNVRSVAIAGLGNVAVDCARVLLRSPEDLAVTDLAEHALQALKKSTVKEVHLIGRRGPAQAAFTPKELRELLGLDNVAIKILPDGVLNLGPACQAEISVNRIKKRVVEVLTKASSSASQDNGAAQKTLYVHFLRSPIEITASKDDSSVASGLDTEIMQLKESESGQNAVGTGQKEHLEAQLILKSIGYRSLPIEGAPFDEKRGIIPNTLGAVESHPGLFVCGWLKRGPSGIIGTNLVDAEQTVDTMVQRASELPAVTATVPGTNGLKQLLSDRKVNVVDWKAWEKIDSVEVGNGKTRLSPRQKVVSADEMLKIATGA